MKNGVPFSVVFGYSHGFVLANAEREAMSIVFSEFEGAEFDWQAMKFKERPSGT